MEHDDAPARAALLRAALQCFAAHGFEGASTRAIAAAAGTNQGLIRHHFGSKEGLWRELVERGVADLQGAFEREDPTAVLADRGSEHDPRRLLAHLIVHALLEPGARRDWLVRAQLDPLRARLRLQLRALPPNDAWLFAWLAVRQPPSVAPTPGPWSSAGAGARAPGPWSAGSTSAGAS